MSLIWRFRIPITKGAEGGAGDAEAGDGAEAGADDVTGAEAGSDSIGVAGAEAGVARAESGVEAGDDGSLVAGAESGSGVAGGTVIAEGVQYRPCCVGWAMESPNTKMVSASPPFRAHSRHIFSRASPDSTVISL